MVKRPSRRTMTDALAWLGFVVLCLLYALERLPILKNERMYLWHDNAAYFFQGFYYFAASLADGYGFPRIFPQWGGSEIAMTSVNYGHFTPHRLLGYALYAATSITPLAAYKLSILAGVLLNGLGWFLLWRRTLPRPNYALFGALLYFWGGIGITVWHQEMDLFSLSWLPWALLCAVEAARNPRWLAPAAACAGAALASYYPQIHAISGCLLAAAGLATRAPWRWPVHRGARVCAAAAFLLAASPAAYILARSVNYSSPARYTASLGASDLAGYLSLNAEDPGSSAPSGYLGNLLRPSTRGTRDQAGFFITRAGIALAAVGVAAAAASPVWMFLPLAAGVWLWACLGVFGGLPQLLFRLHFPAIGLFRQWYHFYPYADLALITLACLGLDAAEKAAARLSWPRALRAAAVVVLVGAAAVEGWRYDRAYLAMPHDGLRPSATLRLSAAEVIASLNGGGLGWPYEAADRDFAIIARREDSAFFDSCPKALSTTRSWPIPAGDLPTSESGWCRVASSGGQAGNANALITPSDVRLQGPSGRPSSVLIALNPSLILPSPGASLAPAASGAMTAARFSGQASLPLAGGEFLAAVAAQYVAVAAALAYALAESL